jgi:TldD protein
VKRAPERLRSRARPALAVLAAAAALLGASSPPQSDPLMTSLSAELERSRGLHVESLEKPYFVAYRLGDVESFGVEASLGEIVSAPDARRTRWLRPEVRIGTFDFDSSEFFSRRSFSFGRTEFGRPVVQDDGLALRQDAWLATDEAYKAAAERLAQKRAAAKNRVEAEVVADYTPEAAAAALLPARSLPKDLSKWQELVRRVSSVFRDSPAIQESSVNLSVSAGRKYLLTTEGTRLRLPAGLATLSIRASTQASDGAPLRDFAVFGALRVEDLPPETELVAAARRIAQTLNALRTAPVLDSYTGPVLFAGQASAELFGQILVPQVSGHRPPTFEMEQMAASAPRNELADKLDRPVLPAFLTVVDDATRQEFGGRTLFGTYAFDDEGVKAAPVTLVENGVLKTLLMSRRPRKEIGRSNGHGRGSVQGGIGAGVGNLFVQVAEGKATADLRAELLRRCREEGLKFGLLLRVLDQPAGGGMGFSGPARQGRSALGSPIEAYRVFVEDGREELVRGLVPGEVTVRSLRDIVAAGAEPTVVSRLYAAASSLGLPESVPASIVAPSVLIREIEFTKEPGPRQRPPLLESPLAGKASGAP